MMRLFKTLPLPNSTYSSCREYYNNTNDHLEKHSVQYYLFLPNNPSCYYVFHNVAAKTYNNLHELSLQYPSSSTNIFFPTNLRGDYVAAHHDNARTAHMHGVALEPQLALPLSTELSVLHEPEHCHWSALRMRVGLRGQRERRLHKNECAHQRHTCDSGLTPLPSRLADWPERLDERSVPDGRRATGVASRQTYELTSRLCAELGLSQEISVRVLCSHVNY